MLFTPFSLALLAFLACNGCQKAFYEGSTKAKTCIDTSRWGQLLVPVWNRIRCAGGTLWDDICAKVSCIHVGTDGHQGRLVCGSPVALFYVEDGEYMRYRWFQCVKDQGVEPCVSSFPSPRHEIVED